MKPLHVETRTEANFFETGWLLSDPEAGLVHFGTGRPQSPGTIAPTTDAQLSSGSFWDWAAESWTAGAGLSWDVPRFRSWLLDQIESTRLAESSGPARWSWSISSRGDYEPIFRRCLSLIETGRAEKLVPVLFDHAEKKEGEIGAPDIAHWLKTSLPLLDQPRVWVYGQWTPGFGFFGATPELLLQAQRRPLGRAWDLRTMALAGTAPRSSVAKWPTEKDLREHESVVRDLVERWPGAQQTPMQEVTTTTGLRHLLTEIYHSCDFAEPREIEKVVAAMHPTPALGARPRSALGELKRAELEPRGGFGAPVYVSTPNRVLAVVAIRGFDWANRRLRLGAGGGLVAKSEIELEWQEQVTKRESVRRFWGFV